MQIKKIYIGGWFQRTTLHLSEIWEFLEDKRSELDLSANELQKYHQRLEIKELKRESGILEYIEIKTANNILCRIYEDGLMILEKPFKSLYSDIHALEEYYNKRLSPAISFIFSKGAPVPKELATIKTILPFIINTQKANPESIEKLFKEMNDRIHATIAIKDLAVYRGSKLLVINNIPNENIARQIIESQIFFREFKTQLHRYLNIHRIIWEKIEHIKERGQIRGYEIDPLRNELTNYQKTIMLIASRIDQMSSYMETRKKIASLQKIDSYIDTLFQFRFEALEDTHKYIKHLWEMTQRYIQSTLDIFNDLQAKSTKNSITSLQLVTSIGVVAAILGYLNRDILPKVTAIGWFYLIVLIGLAYLLNKSVTIIYRNRKYALKGGEIIKEIK